MGSCLDHVLIFTFYSELLKERIIGKGYSKYKNKYFKINIKKRCKKFPRTKFYENSMI